MVVKLEARKDSGNIIISEDSFEHLLNCLDNQKFMSLPDDWTKESMQDSIDDFNRQCRNLLYGGKND